MIEWRSLEPLQVGWVGSLGLGTVCHVLPMSDGKGKWPWQVQFQSNIYYEEWLRPARNIEEAKWVAEIGVSNLLHQFGLVPDSLLAAESELMFAFRNRRRECGDVDRTFDYHDWLDETGWYTPAAPEAVVDRGAVTFTIGGKTVTGYFDDHQAENLGAALFEMTSSR